ncbi:GntR family transcriptional regulator [Anaerorhabdus sp.]|uniref:GntR family transcriptional regulator n=1 Tax=Anaerorhabdus sp. TaxID=1872524 RepID=UPI002FC849C0
MNNLQNNVAAPLYQQLYDAIMEKIESGEYKIGSQIPSEEQLSQTYNVSRITVRSAIQKLCNDNVLVKKHGKGTFVSLPVFVETVSAEGSFTKSCLQAGKIPSTEVIFKGLKKVDKRICDCLNITEQEQVIHMQRLRFIDGRASMLEEDYFIANFDFMLNKEVESQPLLDVIRENTGNTAKFFDDVIEIKYATKEQAKHLDCVVGTPLLYISQLVVGDMNQVLYYNEQYIRSDIYKFSVRSSNK